MCCLPGASCANLVGVATCTGVVLDIAVPSPIWFDELSPQHHATPPARNPHDVWPSTRTCVQSVAVPTCCGVPRSMMSPMPSSPSMLRPQHHSAPALSIAHVV